MPANTPLGFPYPLPSDPLANGAAAIQALALAVDAAQRPAMCKILASTSNQSIPNNTITDLDLAGGTAVVDTGGMASIGTDRIVIQTSGWYDIAAGVNWAANATGARALLIIAGTLGTVHAQDYRSAAPAGYVTSQSAHTTLALGVGNVVGVRLFQNSGAALNAVTANDLRPWVAAIRRSPL